MRDLQIINELENNIKTACTNPLDYEGYVENCLLYDMLAICKYYDRDKQQINYLVHRALLRLV